MNASIVGAFASGEEVYMAKATRAIPEGFHTVTPQLSVDDAAAAIDWYKNAIGATEIFRGTGPDGKIMHAELRVGDSRFIVNDVMAGQKGPQAYGGSPVSLWLYVDNSDALFNRAVSAGAKVQMPIADQFWGDRAGCIVDPAGYTWWIATRKEDLTRTELEQRAADFFKQMAHSAPAR
jgi:PhnB protein